MRRRELMAGLAATTALTSVSVACKGPPPRRRPENLREVTRIHRAVGSKDGAGVKLRRAVGMGALPMLDPFLLLDEIHSSDPRDYQRGFPEHPHRGFETVSILLKGAFEHRDSVGNRGLIADGGVQWMTAGSGIIHSEMPQTTGGEELWGLQLWVNLPAKDKMIPPRYQDLTADDVPKVDVGDALVRVMAGEVKQTRGPVDGVAVRPTLLDASLEPGAVLRHPVPGGDTVFAWILEGSLEFGAQGKRVEAGHTAVFGEGTELGARSQEGGRMLLFAAAPIGEPVARRGPFVMNTDEELRQAFDDYRRGRLVG